MAGLVVSGNGLLRAQTAEPSSLPPGKARDLISVACTQCHTLKPVLMLRDGAPGWRNFVQEMVLRGAQLSPEEAELVVAYLAENLGPRKDPVPAAAVPSSAAASQTPETKPVSLPPGTGKNLVETRCRMCHDLARVVTVKRSRDEWERITKSMVERGAQATPEEARDIVSYLSSAFGKPAE
jgi:cytochrome c5